MNKNELRQIIKEVLNLERVPNMIESQIHKFRMELGFTYKEIARALVYFYDVKKNKYEAMYGIGIVPNVVSEANKYYERLRIQREEQLKSVEESKKHSNIILEVKHIPKRRERKIIDIESLVIDDD